MKVFVSWSGKLSKCIAQQFKKWLPCIIQSLEVFYSADDIEKGENWDSKISAELSKCNYGIVCLTSENTSAPWVNFEAGAIAKTLESKISAVMVDIQTSEIQGPLKRYQATKLEKDDMWQLILDINSATDSPLDLSVLEGTFNAIWEKMYAEIRKIVDGYKPEKKTKDSERKIETGKAIEEILQMVRKQNVLLSSPEQLFPPDYYCELQKRYNKIPNLKTFEQLFYVTERLLNSIYHIREIYGNQEIIINMLRELHINDLLEIIINISRDPENGMGRSMYRSLKEKYIECMHMLDD